MRFQVLALAFAAAATVSAAPTPSDGYPLCGGTFAAYCCKVDVLGVVDASCKEIPNQTNIKEFEKICKKEFHGRVPECCETSANSLSLICTPPNN